MNVAASPLRPDSAGCVLRLRATPNAPRTVPDGVREAADGPRLVLRVKAPPVEGKANAEVLRWAAEFFEIPRAALALLRGGKAREKDLLLGGVDVATAAARLGIEP